MPRKTVYEHLVATYIRNKDAKPHFGTLVARTEELIPRIAQIFILLIRQQS